MNTRPSTRSMTGCASNRLYHNDVQSFGEAMSLVLIMCEQERYQCPRAYPIGEGGRIEFEVNASLEEYASYAREARKLWSARAADHEALADAWTRSPIAEWQAIGEALRSGEYSGLAV